MLSLFFDLDRFLALIYHIDVLQLFDLAGLLATFLSLGSYSERFFIRKHARIPLYLLFTDILILASLVELLPDFVSLSVDSLDD